MAERLAHQLGVANAIRFLGMVPWAEIPRYLAASDAMLLPSRYEGNARVLAEAAAAGKPVVTTDVSGASDTVIPGETGYVVSVERPDLFAAAILELLSDRERMPAMGLRAREHVRALYHESALLPAFADFWARTAWG